MWGDAPRKQAVVGHSGSVVLFSGCGCLDVCKCTHTSYCRDQGDFFDQDLDLLFCKKRNM